MEERRIHNRLTRELPFRYRLYEKKTEVYFDKKGLILDISAGGLRFLALESIEKNRQVLLELDVFGWKIGDEVCIAADITGQQPSAVVGTVMWCLETAQEDQFEVGVRFTGRLPG